MKRKLFQLIGSGVSGKKGRWITVGFWIVLVALLTVLFPTADSQKNERAEIFLIETDSAEANEILEREFPNNNGIPALLTWFRSEKLSDEDLQFIQQLSMELSDTPIEGATVPPFHEIPLPVLKEQISEDGTTFVLPVIFDEGLETQEISEKLESIKVMSGSVFPENPFDAQVDDGTLLVRATGPAGISVDATELFSQGDLSLLIGTVIIVLVFLLVIYRSPILALIPLISVGIAYSVISPVLGMMSKLGWIEFDSQAIAIMTVLLFGAGTDYCLFLISKFRKNLKLEVDKFIALNHAFAYSWGAISMSGLTVVAALIVLLVADYGAIHRFAIPFSLAIFIMMIASLTLVPALLAILGRASFFPFVPRTNVMLQERAQRRGKEFQPNKDKTKIGSRIGTLVTKSPWKVTITTIILLGVLAGFSTKIELTYDTLSSFPEDMPSREGFAILAEHFNSGELAPVSLIVESDDSVALEEQLRKLELVEEVSAGMVGANNTNLVKYELELTINPYSNEAIEYIPVLREKITTFLSSQGVAQADDKVWIAGQTAEQYDTSMITKSDEKAVIPIIIILISLLLLVYLRSIVATVYLVATVLLSYLSALGLGWIILHHFFGVEAIQGFIPLYAFVFIVALGEDYNIFMISSIWKRSKEVPLLQAIKEGVAETGGVITSAGLILAGTFAVLTTLPIQILVHFGTITAIGVLLDTFVVRPFLVPALTTLLGKWAFWPWKRRMLLVEENSREREYTKE
ncbi:MMPL family transporter [Litchfieldia salsa]|uniref:Putative drug exporter of the RND superfamily n=1 Tax=Litchfieldia salsa TaxID=930152 RepID=A0A1H0U8R3_9BACI|nr:MMPL family transporter [Litchfieldia salsa]SDP62667.1 putative drug exporter of the RND superfamily [Litchfieldia salsa]